MSAETVGKKLRDINAMVGKSKSSSSQLLQPSILQFLSPRQTKNSSSSRGSGGAGEKENVPIKKEEDKVISDPEKMESKEDIPEEIEFSPLQIVRAKFSNYPPWPAIVCLDSTKSSYLDGKGHIHVQFFDRPVSRAWVPLEGLVDFAIGESEQKGVGSHWRKALDRANREATTALGMSIEKRQKLIISHCHLDGEQGVTSEEEEKDDDEDYEQSQPRAKRARRDGPKMTTSVKTVVKKTKAEAKVEDDDDYELSEYELIRQRNVEERKKLFAELQLLEAKTTLSNTVLQSSSKSSNPSRRGLAAKITTKTTEEVPVRKSLRLMRIQADEALVLPEKEPSLYVTPNEHPRLPLKELELSQVVSSEQDLPEKSEFLQNVAKFAEESSGNNVGFGSDIRKALANLSITEDRVAKVVPDRIFSLAVHPTESKHLIAAGGKWGSVGLWDVLDLTSESHGVHSFTPHSRPINSMSFSHLDANKLVTSSYDGTVRCLDLSAQTFQLIYGEDDDDSFVAYHRQLDNHTYLLALGDLVGVVDTRLSNEKLANSFQLYHRGAVKTVDIHPIKRDIFLCANNKGQCATYDLRVGSKRDDLMPSLLRLEGHTKAISSAFFSGETGKSVCTVCADDNIRLFCSWAANESEVLPYKTISHNNQTGRWLTTFKAEWHPRRDDVFFVGSMKQPRQIDVFSGQGVSLGPLKGEDLGSICSIVKCHPTLDMVVGGNSSGRVHVFM